MACEIPMFWAVLSDEQMSNGSPFCFSTTEEGARGIYIGGIPTEKIHPRKKGDDVGLRLDYGYFIRM